MIYTKDNIEGVSFYCSWDYTSKKRILTIGKCNDRGKYPMIESNGSTNHSNSLYTCTEHLNRTLSSGHWVVLFKRIPWYYKLVNTFI